MSAALLITLLLQAPPVFRTDVESVYLDVYVTRRGSAVAGLQAEDFVVRDDGALQNVRLLDRSTTPITAVLAVDNSASVVGEPLEHLKAAARSFVAGLGSGDEAALVGIRHSVDLLQAPTSDRARLRAAIDRMQASGLSSVLDGLYLCLERSWGRGRPVLVLFTDGQDTTSWLENADVERAARESSTLVYVVGTQARGVELSRAVDHLGIPVGPPGIPESGRTAFLRRIAEATGGGYRWVQSSAGLERAFREILDAVNARYVLAFEPRARPKPGRHKLDVSVSRRGLEVRAREEYFVP
jgi:VWFA-related protein